MIALDVWPVLAEWRVLASGLVWTLALSAVGAVGGLMVGVACAGSRFEGPKPLAILVIGYVEFIRNTPFIVQLFFILFGLPALGLRLSPEVAAMIAVVVNFGAYATEIVRAGVQATPPGQIEAARALALSRLQTYGLVVLPPALFRVWPALVSQVVIVMLGTAVCGQISVEELSWAANLIHSRNFRAFEALLVASAVYLLVAAAARHLLNRFGKNLVLRSST
jgi:polar amino acid transport system permease protein